VNQAAYVLSTAAAYVPTGAIHLAVVDPGVGSERRAIAVQTARAIYVAPDNGVLSLALQDDPPQRIVHLTEARYHLAEVSDTFHGRDIFAPAAAHLARGVDLGDMGPQIEIGDLVRLPSARPRRQEDGTWLGEILHVDHFGNLITSFPGAMIEAYFTVEVGAAQILGLSRTFADVAQGELVAYVGSSGYLEIAVRGGDAAGRLGAGVGDPVGVRE
jgi:S-adenosylmethionine hydrolase